MKRLQYCCFKLYNIKLKSSLLNVKFKQKKSASNCRDKARLKGGRACMLHDH